MSPILNTDGKDIRGALERAAHEAGIPLELILAGAIAESGLNPRAERYGDWPDVSFGYSQRIVLYHYIGDHTNTPENIAAVRDYVFANPGRDLLEMGKLLRSCLDRAGGDLLNALVIYNAGHLPAPNDPWWQTWQGNVASYQAALEQAANMIS